VLLGRRGAPLLVDSVDHMITNAVTISGSRGHLGGAFPRVIALYQAGLLPLTAVITGELESLCELPAALRSHDDLLERHCKVLVKIT
jgi:threonine dehydrogenase-like Zn-dependent dehydrogenase